MSGRGDGPTGYLQLPDRTAALVDQAALAGGNLMAFLVFARQITAESWGQFGFAFSMVLFAQGFQRAAVTIALVPYSASAVPWPQARARWQASNGAVAVASVLALGATAMAAGFVDAGWIGASAAMACLMVVPMFGHEFMRRSAIQDSRFDALAAGGLCYAAVVVSIAALSLVTEAAAWWPSIAVAAAAGCATLVLAVRTRHLPMRWPRLWSPAPDYPKFAAWAGLSHLGYSGYNFGIQAVLAAVAGPASVGVFHACRILVQPVNTVIGATDSIDKPRAARAFAAHGRSALRHVLIRAFSMMMLLGLPYLVLVGLFAQPMLSFVLGPQYADETTTMRLWCAVAICMMLAQPVESGLYVTRRTRQMFLGRLLASALALALAVPLARQWGAAGALGAMMVGFAIAAVCGLFTLRQVPEQER
jgi:O-antigen/teichoic acid export membrane protein